MKPLVISFSGGRTSAYMCYKIVEEKKDIEKLFIFSNTGMEREETLVFVDKVDKLLNLNLVWVEAEVIPEKGEGTTFRIVDFETASRDGKPFEDMVNKYGIPNHHYPHCTRELKQRPINKYAKSIFGDEYDTAIGMRMDELGRAGNRKNKVYPLIEWWPTWEIQVRKFWNSMPFDLELKDYQGNCDLCWKKSLRKRLTLIDENPDIINLWSNWESKSEYTFDRDNIPLTQLLEMSKSTMYKKVLDMMEKPINQPISFDLDRESSCFCSI